MESKQNNDNNMATIPAQLRHAHTKQCFYYTLMLSVLFKHTIIIFLQKKRFSQQKVDENYILSMITYYHQYDST